MLKFILDIDAQVSKVTSESIFILFNTKEKSVQEKNKSLTTLEEVLLVGKEREEK